MTPTVAQQAMRHASEGRVFEGLQLLRAAQKRGDAEAYLLEGLWMLEGRFVRRDQLGARTALEEAAERGHIGAARALAGLIACGIGAPPAWDHALSLLDRWSDRDPIAKRQLALIGAMSLDEQGRPSGKHRTRVVCADPRIERVDCLLTRDECAFLVELAVPRMRRATIFHELEKRFVEDPIRRSDKASFPIVSEWPFVRALNLRIAAASRTLLDCGEPLQVLRYTETQEYRPHQDAIAGMSNPRVLTALVWLNEDYCAGETRFEKLGIVERGRTGDMLLFANVGRDGEPDPRTLHSGMPVSAGTKYLASRWIRSRPPGELGFGRHEVEQP